MGGRIIVESVAGCLWNRWPDGRGIRNDSSISCSLDCLRRQRARAVLTGLVSRNQNDLKR